MIGIATDAGALVAFLSLLEYEKEQENIQI